MTIDDATEVVAAEATTQIQVALEQLRLARALTPNHEIVPATRHMNCEVCILEKRVDWILSKIVNK